MMSACGCNGDGSLGEFLAFDVAEVDFIPAMFFDGAYIDIVVMGILRTEWRERMASSGEEK